jgi:hypothetical protein
VSEENIADVRRAEEAAKKEAAEAKKRVADLEIELNSLRAQNAFRDAGLAPEQGELFVAANPGVVPDVEAVKQFADRFGLKVETPAPTPEPQGSTPPPGSNLGQFNRAGSGPGEGGQQSANVQSVPRADWEKMLKTDKDAALKAIKEGRVQIRTDNPFAPNSGNAGDNPYQRPASAAE